MTLTWRLREAATCSAHHALLIEAAERIEVDEKIIRRMEADNDELMGGHIEWLVGLVRKLAEESDG